MYTLKKHYSTSYRLGWFLVGLVGVVYMPLSVEAADCTAYTLIGYETAGGAVALTDIEAGDCPPGGTTSEHESAGEERTTTAPTMEQYILAGFFTLLTVLLLGVCVAVGRTYPTNSLSLQKSLSLNQKHYEGK